MRRGCLWAVVGVLGICVVGCALGYLFGLPRLRENVRQPLEEVVGTQIARQIAPNPNARPEPGSYVINADELNSALRAEVVQTDLFDDVAVNLAPDGFELRFTTNDQEVFYHGNIAAVDGRLAVTDISADGWLTTFLPADEVRKAFENAINGYLVANGLRLTDAELGQGTLTLTTEAASG
ncbi:MAG: hypothetical protein QOG89_3349 [Thermomicrobiales bacterium]|nr:hypothetical protein [Thermomicrobiales bacterium]